MELIKIVIEEVDYFYSSIVRELQEREEAMGTLAGSHINISAELEDFTMDWSSKYNAQLTAELEALFIDLLSGRLTTSLLTNNYVAMHEVVDGKYIIAIATH